MPLDIYQNSKHLIKDKTLLKRVNSKPSGIEILNTMTLVTVCYQLAEQKEWYE